MYTYRRSPKVGELLQRPEATLVLKVFDHGMVIDWIEVVAPSTSQNTKVNRHRQVWWVFVWADEAIDRYEGEPS